MVALLVVLFLAVHAGAAPLAPLAAPPLGEQWFSISVNDERAGFARQTISKRPDGYEISIDSSVKLTVLGFSREAAIRERYRVTPGLALISFFVEQTLDGSRRHLSGTAGADGISLTVENAGKKKTSKLKAKGPVYPAAALNIYPFMKGFVPGRNYRLATLDAEALKIKEVVVTAVGVEGALENEVFRLRNDIYPFVDNDIWVNRQGQTLKESVRDGLVVTQAEDAAAAGRHLAQTALAKKDLVFDFSLVTATPPVRNPAALTRLTVDFSGWPEDLAFPEDARQKLVSRNGTTLTVALAHPAATLERTPLSDDERKRFLDGTERIIPEHPEIRALKDAILGEETDPPRSVGLLARWVALQIESSVTDSQSPVETLKSRTGNCQAHARLYASLARAAGIPTRFVSGLVWMPDKGFLYHSWAESHVAGSWLSVDPTFGQVPADLTHIRMFDGDAPDDVAPLARVIGRLKAAVVAQDHEPLPAPP